MQLQIIISVPGCIVSYQLHFQSQVYSYKCHFQSQVYSYQYDLECFATKDTFSPIWIFINVFLTQLKVAGLIKNKKNHIKFQLHFVWSVCMECLYGVFEWKTEVDKVTLFFPSFFPFFSVLCVFTYFNCEYFIDFLKFLSFHVQT